MTPEEHAEFLVVYTQVTRRLKTDITDPELRLSLKDIVLLTGFSIHTVDSWIRKGRKDKRFLPVEYIHGQRYSTVAAVEWYTGLELGPDGRSS